jgi:bacterioferritin-associated ferredoxin
MYICLCKGISEDHVRQLGEWGITQPTDLIDVLELEDRACCGKCARNVTQFVELACEGRSRSFHGSPSGPLARTDAAAAIL